MASFLHRIFSPSKAAAAAAAKEQNRLKRPRPEQLLDDLKKHWTYVHQVFFIETARDNIHVSQTEIPDRLREIVSILAKEDEQLGMQATMQVATPTDTRPDVATGMCMEYFLNQHVMQNLYDHAFADFPQGMLLEVTMTFSQLVSELDDRFLVQSGVHMSILKLLKRGLMGENAGEETLDTELAQLMFNMCSKLHERPELLHIFFCERQPSNKTTPNAEVAIASMLSPSMVPDPVTVDPEIDLESHEFPLFIYLTHFISNTTKVGDIARAALIICLEIATESVSNFVIHRSNFCRSIISVVGSLYSDLPNTLGVQSVSELMAEPRVKAFISILEYCQQVMVKADIRVQRALSEEFSNAFLERFLGPQLFNAAVDDPASVTLWTIYTERSLRKVDHPLLTWAYGDFLLKDSVFSFVDGSMMTQDEPVPRLLQRLESPSASLAEASWQLLYTLVSLRPSPAVLRLFPSVLFKTIASSTVVGGAAPNVGPTAVVTEPMKVSAKLPDILLSSLARRYIILLPYEDLDVITKGYMEYQQDAETAFEYACQVLKHLESAYPEINIFTRGQPQLPLAWLQDTSSSNVTTTAAKDTPALSQTDVDLLGLLDSAGSAGAASMTPLTPIAPVPVAAMSSPAPMPKLREDPFKSILLQHLSSLLSASEDHNLLVTGIVTGLAVFPHSELFASLFNIPRGMSTEDVSTIYGALRQMSRSCVRSFNSRDALINAAPEAYNQKPTKSGVGAGLLFFEEFVKELTAAVQVQSLANAERVLFVDSP